MIGECYIGDVRDGLRAMISVGVKAQTCVTSPPYWGLRDYGVPGQLGLEPTIAEYIENMVHVFRLVWEVLADDGTLWLNMGDSYATGAGSGNSAGGRGAASAMQTTNAGSYIAGPNRLPQIGLKPKDLCGMPWRVAFALQAAGWYLRSDIIWAKPNPMPESVTDRCTKSHEYLFLLSKRERYYYDADAIAEEAGATNGHDHTGGGYFSTPPGQKPQSGNRKSKMPDGWDTGPGAHGTVHRDGREKGRKVELARGFRGGSYVGGEPGPRTETGNTYAPEGFMRNKRSVWTIATAPYKQAHFATFPPKLIEPCILAGSRVGDVVLDPFMGSGTVAMVAQSLGRRWIGCELNPAYVVMQKQRAAQSGLELHATVTEIELSEDASATLDRGKRNQMNSMPFDTQGNARTQETGADEQ